MIENILGFDFETTSNKPETTRVVQVAAKMNGEVIFNQLCNPQVDITDGAREVHGISNEMVANAELDTDAVKRLAEFILERKGTIILAGHNCTTFDVPILWRLAGIEDPPKLPVIDTLTCAIRTLPHAPDHKLGTLTQFLKLGDAANAHDALADIEMVFMLIDKFRSDLGYTVPEMLTWLSTPRVLQVCHFGKHKGKPWGGVKGSGGVPYFYAKFIADNFDSVHPDVEATLRYHYGIICKNGN